MTPNVTDFIHTLITWKLIVKKSKEIYIMVLSHVDSIFYKMYLIYIC